MVKGKNIIMALETTYAFSFTTTNPIPKNGKIEIFVAPSVSANQYIIDELDEPYK